MMDPDKILFPYEDKKETEDTWRVIIRYTIQGKLPYNSSVCAHIIDYKTYFFKRYVCKIYYNPKIHSSDFLQKSFFFLSSAKKYMDTKLKLAGYILIDDTEKIDKYKLLL